MTLPNPPRADGLPAHVSDSGADDRHLDGNALAGPLRDLFAVDVTAAGTRCAGCGWTGVVAELVVYPHGDDGGVGRCAGCGDVVLRLVRGPATAWLDLRGASWLRVDLPS